jgi:molybdopterin synthase catalytic subunit
VAERIKADLREARLSLDEAIAHVSHAGAGGLSVFVGVVRDHNDGRQVTRLDYSAYTAMAKREMQAIADEIEVEVSGVRVCALHRVGELDVGDAAIVCAASAPHRGEAFDACRLLIDRIKAREPIWKREWGPHGAAWVGWEDARCTPGESGHSPDHSPDHEHKHKHAHDPQHGT